MHVLTLDCLHAFAIDISTLADNWGERAVACPLEHVVIQDRGKYGEALPVRTVAPRVFDDEERLRRERKAEPFRGTVRPERFPVRARSSVGHGPGNPGPWEWRQRGNGLFLVDAIGWTMLSIELQPDWKPSISPAAWATIAAAPEMLALLRIAAYETQPNGVCGDIHTTGTFRADMLALIARIDAAVGP